MALHTLNISINLNKVSRLKLENTTRKWETLSVYVALAFNANDTVTYIIMLNHLKFDEALFCTSNFEENFLTNILPFSSVHIRDIMIHLDARGCLKKTLWCKLKIMSFGFVGLTLSINVDVGSGQDYVERTWK